ASRLQSDLELAPEAPAPAGWTPPPSSDDPDDGWSAQDLMPEKTAAPLEHPPQSVPAAPTDRAGERDLESPSTPRPVPGFDAPEWAPALERAREKQKLPDLLPISPA